MIPLVVLTLLAAGPEWHSANTHSHYMDADGGVWPELHALSDKPLPDRIASVSAGFLDTPYLVSPLGEGAGAPTDPDPTFRLDAVDCLTFVEETVALSLAKDETQLGALLDQLRYGEKRAYEDRNHLMEAQWLPRNVEKGFLRDVTDRYGGADAVWAEKVITRKTWTSRSSSELKLPADKQVVGTFRFRMIPLEKVLTRAKKVPSGTLMIVIREDLPLKVTRVTHLGFIVQKKGRPILRHAARNVFGRVVDEELENFLTRNGKYEKWKVSGVSFYEVTSPGPAKAAQAQP